MIRTTHLYKSFDGVPVLEDVSVEIRPGETFAVIGRSGSGKSVLLKCLVGLLEPDAGEVIVGGERLTRLSRRALKRTRRQFGMLFQGGALFDSMTAFDNVAFPLRMRTRLSETEIARRVDERLEMVELRGMGPKKPAELSGGQKKRVALARAIAGEPDFLFCDEPNSGLDPQTATLIDNLLARLTRELHMTTVLVTHDMRSVLDVADRVGFLHERRMHFVGTTRELRRSRDEALCRFIEAGAYQPHDPQEDPTPDARDSLP